MASLSDQAGVPVPGLERECLDFCPLRSNPAALKRFINLLDFATFYFSFCAVVPFKYTHR